MGDRRFILSLNISFLVFVLFLPAVSFAEYALIYDNSDTDSYYFVPNVWYFTEVLDYGTSGGGTITRFTFGYATTLSNPGTITIRFYRGTNWNTRPGTKLKTFNFSGLSGSGLYTKTYDIPPEDQFYLTSGKLGYSYEFNDPCTGALVASGGTGTEDAFWGYDYVEGTWYWSWFGGPPEPWSGFYMQLYTGTDVPDPNTCIIEGYKFDDTNSDGNWDGSEPGLSDWEIYLDINDNDVRDTGEPNAMTDSNGYYRLINIDADAGPYTVAEVMHPGWVQTMPGGDGTYLIDPDPNGIYKNINFGNTTAPMYCSAVGGTSVCDYGIMGFKLKTIDNPTSYCEQYADYTSISTELEIGTGYPVLIVTDWTADCALWIDWNQDLDFDDVNEQINVTNYSWQDPPYDDPLFSIYYTGIITPPQGAVLGPTRLRIRTRQFGNTLLPCGDTLEGEVEDYTVIVAANGTSGEETYGGGQGTEQSPFLIYTPENMQAIGENNFHWTKYFKQMADIDLSSYTNDAFNIIGDFMFNFTGVFDGNGHAISNFTYSATGEDRIGIFGEVSGGNALIKNITVIDPNVQAQNGEAVGALAGAHKGGLISACSVRGGSVSGEIAVGGFVGGNHAAIEDCYSTTSVSGVSYAGGLVGYNLDGTVNNSYSRGDVLGNSWVGGLVGRQRFIIATISNSYSTSHVTAGGSYVGGLAGDGGTVTNSFWDSDIGGPDNGLGTGLGTTEMQMQSTFTDAGWDFTTPVWAICDGTNYPKLAWQVPLLGDFVCPDGVEINDLNVIAEEWLLEKLSADIAPAGGDGIINSLDFALFALAWQSTDIDGNWDPACDIAPPGGNGIVNINDLIVLLEQWLRPSAYLADIATPPDGDGKVDLLDFALFAQQWLEGVQLPACAQADITGNGDVDLADFAILASQWLDLPGTPSADIALPLDNFVDGLDLVVIAEYWCQTNCN